MVFGSFFDSIKTDLGSAVDWVHRNSGTIGTVAGVIGKVAGAILVIEDVDDVDDKDDVVQLQRNYNAATEYLEQQADSKVQALLSARVTDSSTPTKDNAAKFTGIWTAPSFNNEDGQPQVAITQDVSKFLDQQCIPSIYTTKSNKVIDIAQTLAQAAFVGADINSAATDANGVTTYPISISIEGEGFALTGAHSFYQLPLGQSLEDQALHSCISVHCSTTPDFRARHAEFRKALFVHAPQDLEAASAGGWLTTLSIVWTSTQFAVTVWPNIQDALTQKNNGYVIQYNTTQGNIQTTKIQAPGGVTPAKTKSDLTDAISTAMMKAFFPLVMSGNTNPPNNLNVQLPTVSIAGTTIIMSSTAMAQGPIS